MLIEISGKISIAISNLSADFHEIISLFLTWDIFRVNLQILDRRQSNISSCRDLKRQQS